MGCNIDESAVIILAAGASGRMGFCKPLLRFNDDESFVERIINIYTEADIGQIILVVNSDLYEVFIRRDFSFLKEVTLVLNTEPEEGRLFSVKLGLEHADPEHFCFVQNIDEPFVELKLLKQLASKAKKNAYAEPVKDERGGHPVLISPEILQRIRTCDHKNLTLKDLLADFQKVAIPVKNESSFININTVAEYRIVFNREPVTI